MLASSPDTSLSLLKQLRLFALVAIALAFAGTVVSTSANGQEPVPSSMPICPSGIGNEKLSNSRTIIALRPAA